MQSQLTIPPISALWTPRSLFTPTGGFLPANAARNLIDGGWYFANGGGLLYLYQEGLYRPGEETMRKVLGQGLGAYWRPKRADDVIRYLYDIARELWQQPPLGRINVVNGILDVNMLMLARHSTSFLSPVRVPVAFDPEADCPLIHKFLAEVFPPDALDLAYEVAGWLLVPDASFQKALLLIGTGANGKSVYLNLCEALLGLDNVANQTLHSISSNRFASSDLYGRLANIAADISSQTLEDVSTFKAIVGGDRVKAERKFKPAFFFHPYARLVFSANRIPMSTDSGLAYWRRWVVVNFPRVFPPKEQDHSLLDKLTSPEELSGFLRHAVAAYRRLKKRGGFTESVSVDAGARQFEDTVDPLTKFLRETVVVAPTASVGKATLHAWYREFSGRNGAGAMSARKFNALLRQQIPGLEDKIVSGEHHWIGIGLRRGRP